MHCEVMVAFVTKHLPCIGTMLGPVQGVARTMLYCELSLPVLSATIVANDLLVATLAAITQGNRSATPTEALSGRLRALARASSAIRATCFGPRFAVSTGQE